MQPVPDSAVNVLGRPLQPCSQNPLTGWFRDGFCNTCAEDAGSHTICVRVSDEFLAWSKYLGNDLTTPVPQYGFPGLKDGDQWCLCASRFMQAHDEGVAPRVVLEATHARALRLVPLEILRAHADQP